MKKKRRETGAAGETTDWEETAALAYEEESGRDGSEEEDASSGDRVSQENRPEETLPGGFRRVRRPLTVQRMMLIGGGILLLFAVFLIRMMTMLDDPVLTPYQQAMGNTVRRVKIAGVRGRILDCEGRELVTNRWTHRVILSAGTLRKADASQRVAWLTALAELMDGCGEGPALEYARLPLYGGGTWIGGDPLTEGTEADWYRSALFDGYSAGEDPVMYLRRRFGLPEDGSGTLLQLVYDCEAYLLDLAGTPDASAPPFTVVTEVRSLRLLTDLETLNTPAQQDTVYERIYPQGGYASHLLGNTGKIRADDLTYYSELGYPMDAIVGISGAEAAFESTLRGQDGEAEITWDAYGRVIKTEVIRQPVQGSDVRLTLDIRLQILAERELAANIAASSTSEAGSLVVTDAETGALLAAATYPTYAAADYFRQYEVLRADERAPLFNRALSGLYAPGSVMKLAVAAAALETGVITPDTQITDTGVYTYDPDYQPRCWLYLQSGKTHGTLGVKRAITVSCNCFFFEVGRQLGIEKIRQYASALGLGKKTGIELPEASGTLAGPDETGTWSWGNTLQAAIGQANHAYTPIQLCVYLRSLLYGGSDIGLTLDASAPPRTPSQTVTISPDTVRLIKEAMRDCTKSGSVRSYFDALPYEAGIKTGTAQTGGELTNAVMTGFYPYDHPKIIVTAVLEGGGAGTACASCVTQVMRGALEE